MRNKFYLDYPHVVSMSTEAQFFNRIFKPHFLRTVNKPDTILTIFLIYNNSFEVCQSSFSVLFAVDGFFIVGAIHSFQSPTRIVVGGFFISAPAGKL